MKATIAILYSAVVISCIFLKDFVNTTNINSILPDRYDGMRDECLLSMEMGYCRAKVKRYYFDTRRMKCSMFYWGGCAGNSNNFATLEDCQATCHSDYFNNVDALKKGSYDKNTNKLQSGVRRSNGDDDYDDNENK